MINDPAPLVYPLEESAAAHAVDLGTLAARLYCWWAGTPKRFPAWEKVMSAITTIVHFEVPADNIDQFLSFWHKTKR